MSTKKEQDVSAKKNKTTGDSTRGSRGVLDLVSRALTMESAIAVMSTEVGTMAASIGLSWRDLVAAGVRCGLSRAQQECVRVFLCDGRGDVVILALTWQCLYVAAFLRGRDVVGLATASTADLLGRSVDVLDLSVRACNVLAIAEIRTIGALTSRTDDEIMRLKNSSEKVVKEVKRELTVLGLTLAGSPKSRLSTRAPGSGDTK